MPGLCWSGCNTLTLRRYRWLAPHSPALLHPHPIPSFADISRVEKIAQLIASEFGDEPLTCLCVLKVRWIVVGRLLSPPNENQGDTWAHRAMAMQGGHQFFADLVDRIKRINMSAKKSVRLAIDFIR